MFKQHAGALGGKKGDFRYFLFWCFYLFVCFIAVYHKLIKTPNSCQNNTKNTVRGKP